MEEVQNLLKEIRAARKVDLYTIADKYKIHLKSQVKKKELFKGLIEELVEQDVLPTSALKEIPSETESAEVTLRKLQIEAEIQKAQIQAETDREIAIAEQEKEKAKIEADKEIQLAQLNSKPDVKTDTPFDASKFVRYLPDFVENDPDLFFLTFQRTAKQLKIDEVHWGILVQNRLTGKALKACSVLSEVDCTYDKIKAAILQAYELIPDRHRQNFRECKRDHKESYSDFCAQLSRLAEKWLRAAEALTYDSLKELILLEQFKSTLDNKTRMFIEEKKPANLKEAGKLADEFSLIYGQSKTESNTHKSGDSKSHRSPSNQPAKEFKPYNKPQNQHYQGYSHGYSNQRSPPVCNYCNKTGHIASHCRKRYYQSQNKPVLSSQSHQQEDKTKRKEKEKDIKKSQESQLKKGEEKEESTNPVMSHQITPSELMDIRFKPYVTVGTVAMDEFGEKKQVNVLRDTGAIQTLLSAEVLSNPNQTYLQ